MPYGKKRKSASAVPLRIKSASRRLITCSAKTSTASSPLSMNIRARIRVKLIFGAITLRIWNNRQLQDSGNQEEHHESQIHVFQPYFNSAHFRRASLLPDGTSSCQRRSGCRSQTAQRGRTFGKVRQSQRWQGSLGQGAKHGYDGNGGNSDL